MRSVVWSLGAIVLSFIGRPAFASGELQVGDLAPAFALQGSDGKVHRLEEYRGRVAVVLAWFPKAFTGG